MIDNKSKKLAFESLALVSSALKLIEIKNLGVFRFGAETECILQLGDELNDQVGTGLYRIIYFKGVRNISDKLSLKKR